MTVKAIGALRPSLNLPVTPELRSVLNFLCSFTLGGMGFKGCYKLNRENVHMKACGGKSSHRDWKQFIYVGGG